MVNQQRKDALTAVEAALGSPSARQAVAGSFGSDASLPPAAVRVQARQAVAALQEALKGDPGLRLAGLKKSEVGRFVKEARTSTPDSFTRQEFEALVATLAKYAALKARRKTARRWGLGLTLSAAGAAAISAAANAAFATNTMLLAAAPPAGAAVGLVAVLASGAKARRRDRREARGPAGAPASPPAAAAPPAAPSVADHAPGAAAASSAAAAAAPIGAERALQLQQQPNDEGAVTSAATAAAATPAGPAPTVPAATAAAPVSAVSSSSASGSHAGDLAVVEVVQHPPPGDEAAAGVEGLPALLRGASPTKDLSDAAPAGGKAKLPPLPLGKAAAANGGGGAALLTNASLKKSFSSLKKALSIKERPSEAGSEVSLDVAPSSARSSARGAGTRMFSLRRPSTDGGSVADSAASADLAVVDASSKQGGSQVKKWSDKLRKSFTVEREAPAAAAPSTTTA